MILFFDELFVELKDFLKTFLAKIFEFQGFAHAY